MQFRRAFCQPRTAKPSARALQDVPVHFSESAGGTGKPQDQQQYVEARVDKVDQYFAGRDDDHGLHGDAQPCEEHGKSHDARARNGGHGDDEQRDRQHRHDQPRTTRFSKRKSVVPQ